MSYSRFGCEGSEVYVYLDVHGYICCCACWLDGHGSFQAFSTAEMIEHLDEHRRAGHQVPNDCYEGLRQDAAENDAWINAEKAKA